MNQSDSPMDLDRLLALACKAEAGMKGPDQGVWLSILDSEHDNFRAALSHKLEHNAAGTALRICAALQPYWGFRDHLEEGIKWSEFALATADDCNKSVDYAQVLNGAGVLSRLLGSFAEARAYHEHSLQIRREIEDKPGTAACFNGLGNAASDEGDYAAARAYYEQSLAIKREMGDRKGIGGSLNNLGFLAFRAGDLVSAQQYYVDSLQNRREFGNLQHIAQSLQGLAEVSAAQGAWERAVNLWGAADALREQNGTPLTSTEQQSLEGDLTAARSALSEEQFTNAWEQGRILMIDQAIDFAIVCL